MPIWTIFTFCTKDFVYLGVTSLIWVFDSWAYQPFSSQFKFNTSGLKEVYWFFFQWTCHVNASLSAGIRFWTVIYFDRIERVSREKVWLEWETYFLLGSKNIFVKSLSWWFISHIGKSFSCSINSNLSWFSYLISNYSLCISSLAPSCICCLLGHTWKTLLCIASLP